MESKPMKQRAVVLALMLCTVVAAACSNSASLDLPSDAGVMDGSVCTTGCSDAALAIPDLAGGSCIAQCRSFDVPNYGGFELAEYDACQACPSCQGFGPCGSNVSPPAGAACVACLQVQLAGGLTSQCAASDECKSFASCLKACP